MNLKELQEVHIGHLKKIGLGRLFFANHTPGGGFTCWTSEPHYPIDYRSIFSNEIVIEPDSPDTEENTHIIRKIAEMLKKDLVPYQLFDSGGKGFHLHVFFKLNFDGIGSLARQAAKFGVMYDTLRYELFW